MSKYVRRFSHFRFGKDGDALVVTSGRDSGFEVVYSWPEELDPDDEIDNELYERFYARVMSDYDSYKSE